MGYPHAPYPLLSRIENKPNLRYTNAAGMGNVRQLPKTESSSLRSSLIWTELEKIIHSEVFARADRLCLFLRFIVETSLRDQSEPLKETLIGVQVYGRPLGYDPKAEPIVRTEARRLRLKLEEYYAGPGQEDRVVITVPRGGYTPQFEIRPEAPPQLVVLPEPRKPRGPFPLGPGTAWAVALLIGTCLGASWLWLAYSRKLPMPPHAIPVTRYPGFEFQPSVSRDGKRVAFVWNGTENNYNIYVKNLDSGDPLRLTTDPAYDVNPAWSPDGRSIAFLRLFPDSTKQILVVPAAGGPERLLCQTHAVQPAWVQDASVLNRLPGPAWSPDGQFLAVSDRSNSQEPDSLYLVSVQTGEKKRVTFPKTTEVGDYYPAFSPDGRNLAFVRVSNQRLSSDLYIKPLRSGDARRITFDSKVISGLTWVSDDRLVFSSNRLGDSLLWNVSLRGGAPETVGGTGRDVGHPTASADGRTLVYAEHFRNTNAWRVPIGVRPAESATKLIASSTSNDSAQYSPDGKRIVFVSDRSGVPELLLCNADGSHPVSLFTGNGLPVGTPRWSPDSQQIVFDTVKKGRSVIEVVDTRNDKSRSVASGSSDYMMPSWSQDGRFFYFVSPTGSETVQIWKQPLTGGPAIQMTKEGGGEASESPDGRTLYFLKALGVWQIPASGGTESLVPGLEHVNTSRYFFISRTGIYFLASENPPWTVHFYNFAMRQISTVATIQRTPEFRTPSMSVSPDEHWLLYTQLDQAGEDLMALKNIIY